MSKTVGKRETLGQPYSQFSVETLRQRIALERMRLSCGEEWLRQSCATFNLRRKEEILWFTLRLFMGFGAVMLLTAVVGVASYILLSGEKFSAPVASSAGAALFVDVLGLLIGVWKIVLNPHFLTGLEPMQQLDPGHLQWNTSEEPDEQHAIDQPQPQEISPPTYQTSPTHPCGSDSTSGPSPHEE